MKHIPSVERALAFLDQHGRPVERARAQAIAGDGSRETVLTALATYQNDDGGFGHGLEPDIAAPDSQPFAARIALLILIDLETTPDESLVTRLMQWLEREQGDDGCWRFAPGVYQHKLAPWFAGWTFPSLNPAVDLAGAATRLGVGSPRLHERVRRLCAQLATLEEARTGEFYNLLPYAEYVPWVDFPEQDAYLAAVTENVARAAESGGFADAGHFFELAGPAGSPISRRLPSALLTAQLDGLESEQQADGGWPTPYARFGDHGPPRRVSRCCAAIGGWSAEARAVCEIVVRAGRWPPPIPPIPLPPPNLPQPGGGASLPSLPPPEVGVAPDSEGKGEQKPLWTRGRGLSGGTKSAFPQPALMSRGADRWSRRAPAVLEGEVPRAYTPWHV